MANKGSHITPIRTNTIQFNIFSPDMHSRMFTWRLDMKAKTLLCQNTFPLLASVQWWHMFDHLSDGAI